MKQKALQEEGQEWLFFLVKHHDGTFHAIPYMTPPLDTKSPGADKQIDAVKKVLATVADPAVSGFRVQDVLIGSAGCLDATNGAPGFERP